MSETDSFIQEVSEEVRRDRLFRLFRRYGWIAIGVVLLIVGGAAYNEWRKSQDRASAQAFGDAMLAALETDSAEARAAALSDIEAETPGRAAVRTFSRAGELASSGDTAAAADLLNELAANGAVDDIYRRIAGFRALTLQPDLPASERRLQFEAFLSQGGILRLLAEEQIALIEIETGDRDAALERVQGIVQDAEATAGLRRRATQLIVSLGGDVPQTTGSAGAVAPVEQ